MIEMTLVGLFVAALVASQLQAPWAFLAIGLALWAAVVYLWWPAGKVLATPPVTPERKHETQRSI